MGSFFTDLRSKNSGLFNALSMGDLGPSRIIDKNIAQRVPNAAGVPDTPYYAGRTPTLADANSGYVHAAQNAVANAAQPKPITPNIQRPMMTGTQGMPTYRPNQPGFF